MKTQTRKKSTSPSLPPLRLRPVWYRRQYFVHPKFQGGLVVATFLIGLLCIWGGFWVILRYQRRVENLLIQLKIPGQNQVIEALSLDLKDHLWMMLGGGVALTLISVIFMILWAHRVVGPLVKVRNVWKKVIETGEFPEEVIEFRKTDLIQEHAQLMRQGFETLHRKHKK